MIFDFMTPIFEAIFNPVVLITLFALIGTGLFLVLIQDSMKKAYEIWYFSESERLIDIKKTSPEQMSPKQVKTKDNYRFLRNSVAYTLKRGIKTVIVWLGKRGTAYTFRPTQAKKGSDGKPVYEKVGTLWDGLKACVGEENLQDVPVEYKEKLITSEIFVTVDLEEGTTPVGFSPMSEQDIFTEANNDMAGLIGHRIRNALNEIDWVEKIALMGSGGLVVLLLQGLGIIPAFGV